jgi:hypothetical protein
MLAVHCFHNNLQLHYISVLFGSRRRAETPCGIGLLYIIYFPSNLNRLVEVFLRALVGYRPRWEDGIGPRYGDGCSRKYKSLPYSRFDSEDFQAGVRRTKCEGFGQENESIHLKGKAHPTRDEK